MNDPVSTQSLLNYKPTTAYIGATWAVLSIGVIAFLFGLWNATGLALSEKGYYGAVLALGLYASISLQKTIRDKSEGIPTSTMYYWISWSALGLAVVMMIVGLMNAGALSLSEKGFYLMAFTMSLFASITIQKNTRDNAQINALQSGSAPTKLIQVRPQEPSEKSLFGSIRSKASTEDVD